jgi:hypothetical protein
MPPPVQQPLFRNVLQIPSHFPGPTADGMEHQILACTKAVWKVRGLVEVRRCYAEGGSDCYAEL